MDGGAGADFLIGGLGADTFAFTALTDSTVDPLGRDSILDMNHDQGDKIELKKIDAIAGGGDDMFKLVDGFTHTAGQLIVSHVVDHCVVQVDVDGDGVADFAIDIYSATMLASGDFML